MKKVFVLTRGAVAFGSMFLCLLPRGLTATANNDDEDTKKVFDVARASRITCQSENDGCTLMDGSFGSIGSLGFADPCTADGDPKDDSLVHYQRTTEQGRNQDNFLELSSCWDFDCMAACDASCSCVNMATQQDCPTTLSPLVPETKPPTDAFHLHEPHVFYDLQGIRMECTESHTKCVIQGFERCGYTVPRYNLYNDESGLFLVDDVDKGDTVLEIRGCNPVLGTAACDAGCTCQDLATNEPCPFTRAAAAPTSLPFSKSNPPPKIVFDGLRKATLSCKAQYARCDEMNGSHVCGSSSSGKAGLATTSCVQPAAFRVDQVQRWPRSANSVTFEACSDSTPFAMECDAGCTCIDANTGRACHCTDASGGQACSGVQDEQANLKLVARVSIGGLVVLGVLLLKCFFRSLLYGKRVGASSKEADAIASKDDAPPSGEMEKVSLVSGNK